MPASEPARPATAAASRNDSVDAPREIPCALCGAANTCRLYTKFDYGIERCRACGLVYANPRAPESRILARYNAGYFWKEYLPAAGAPEGRVDLAWLDRRHAPMLQVIRRAAPRGRTLLEIGTGAGLFLKAASRAGWEVSGLELSPEAAGFARDRLGLDVRRERAEAMSFPPASFDAAVMFDVIEHLFDPRAVLEATRTALRPGGVLVVSTPNFNALSRLALGVEWAVLNPLEHTYYYTASTLCRMLDSCGFHDARSLRSIAGLPIESMNFQSTHAPSAPRTRLYRVLVTRLGGALAPAVRAAGAADALLAVARTR